MDLFGPTVHHKLSTTRVGQSFRKNIARVMTYAKFFVNILCLFGLCVRFETLPDVVTCW